MWESWFGGLQVPFDRELLWGGGDGSLRPALRPANRSGRTVSTAETGSVAKKLGEGAEGGGEGPASSQPLPPKPPNPHQPNPTKNEKNPNPGPKPGGGTVKKGQEQCV